VKLDLPKGKRRWLLLPASLTIGARM
jgi:hypothetical protein